ncbi:MAG: hypothetical protein LBM13_04270 [Candidatus Ancillula sp.]|jgi:magnesium transporter|nr:hypothetical protein [Candidatus Ancillula sp.]
MRIFDTKNLTFSESKVGISKDEIKDKFIIAKKHDLEQLQTMFNFDYSTIIDSEIIDETVRYSNYKEYDFISLIFANEDPETKIINLQELNLYLSQNYLLLIFPDSPTPELLETLAMIEKRINTLFDQNNPHKSWLNRILFVILDSLISSESSFLEQLEDQTESLLQVITTVKKTNDQLFSQIRNLRGKIYATMKQVRALESIMNAIALDEGGYILKEEEYLFKNIANRATSLAKLAQSIYSLTEELLHSYDSKIGEQTNTIVTRLTSVTILMSIWTVIGGVYGMNFDNMPELHWKYGYFAVLAILISVTLILSIFLHKRKLL